MAGRVVAVTDSVFPNLEPAKAVLSKIGGELRLAPEPTAEGILSVARDADAVLTTYAKVTGEMIPQMTKCRVISRLGIVVTKVPDYCLDEVSDHAMALLLALIRKIPSANTRTQSGKWEMKAVVPIHRLRGTVLGLVAFGQIPQLVAPKAQAFGMQVITYDPYVSDEVLKRANVRRVELEELIRTSDYISLHCPLTPETKHLFSTDAFQKMKRSAYLVNTARGPVIDEAALAQALDQKLIAGAALDVMEKEPPGTSPLFGRDDIILTPHTSFYSEESLVDLQTKAAEEVVRVLTGQAPKNPVNPEALQAKQSAKT